MDALAKKLNVIASKKYFRRLKMKKGKIFFAVMMACGFLLLGHAQQASAYSSYYNTYCTSCHGTNSVSTCAGCHSHGTHPDSSKNSLNITAATDKTSYKPGETISVTINGGYRSGWVRALLYDQNMKELARSTGTVIAGAIAPSGAPSFPVTLQAPAPTTPGTYTFNAAWYGNKFDLTDAGAGTTFFGPRWTPDPNNPNHGREIVATNSFTVVSSSPPTTAAITVTDSVAPTTDLLVPFGSVNAGSSTTQTVTVTNTGTANLLVGTVGSMNPLAAPFSVKTDTCSNQTIAPSASCTLTLAFAPISAGTFSDSFNIPNNDPAKSTVSMNVTGTGATAPTPAITVTDSVSPTTDHLVAFGNVTIGASATQTVTVKNTGNADLVLGAVGSANPLATPFTIKTDTCSSQTLAAAASCSVTLAFAPVSASSFTDSFSISSNDAANSTVTMNVSGTGTAAPAPAITVTDSVSPTTDLLLAFGNVTVNASASQTVTIKNTGNADLVLGVVGSADPLGAPFAITTDSCSNQTIVPAAACTLTVAFAPASASVFADSFSIPSNDPAKSTITMNVSGTGAAAPMPHITITDAVPPASDLMLSFGTIAAGSTAAQTVTIKNDGNADLLIATIGSVDPLAPPFMIKTDACSGQTLVPAASCTVALEFSPSAPGTFTDSVSIPSNDPDQKTATLSVSGIGSTIAAGDISVTDSVAPTDDLQVPFGDVREGRSVDNTVTVTNTASGVLVMGSIASINQLAAPFTIVTDTCSGKTISSGETCGVTIRFTPPVGCADSSGTSTTSSAKLSCKYSDSFDIPSNDPDEPAATVQVSGAGVATGRNNPPKKPRPIYPADQQQGLDTTIQMRWEASTDPDGDPVSYDLLVSTTQDFSSSTTSTWASAGKNKMFAGTGMSFIFFGAAFAGMVRKRKVLLLIAALAIMTGTTMVSCSSGSVTQQPSATAVTREISGLRTDTTYYWKVVAKDGNGGATESDVSSFSTK
jgi:hypothetical protein